MIRNRNRRSSTSSQAVVSQLSRLQTYDIKLRPRRRIYRR